MSDYLDPWGPGGKFIESGLHRVDEDVCAPDCPRCNGVDDDLCLCGEDCPGRR